MALQWMILACVVAAEAVVAALLTLPAPRALRNQIVGLVSLLLQPIATVIPFAAFQLLGACGAPLGVHEPSAGLMSDSFAPSGVGADIYWKKEHRLMCTSEVCTADERIRFEKTVSDRYAFPCLGIGMGFV
jgi:hypothetical protein